MRRYPRRFGFAMVALLVLVLGLPKVASAAGPTVRVNGVAISGSQVAMANGQVMVSVRPLAAAMGGSVTWLPGANRATMLVGESQLAVWVHSQVAYLNGQRMTVPVAPYLANSQTMVPAWWVAVRLGAKVSFDGETLTIESSGSGAAAIADPGSGSTLLDPAFMFPFPMGAAYEPYPDTWGDSRSYQGRQFPHEGTDILAKKGTPVVAVAAGRVVRYGWNTLGGYRLTIEVQGRPGFSFYYAHLDRYAAGMYAGAYVQAGQLLGYVGNTGEGPERTEGKFVTHLHFGIYTPTGAINAYPYLRFWEGNKAKL